jgi:hypothetical protein
MRKPFAVGSVVATFFLVAAPAGALVQIVRGIAGARLGASPAAVKAALGSPSSSKSGSNDFGPYLQYRFAGGLTVLFQGRTAVTSVSTTGRGDRTSSGVGVGSSEAAADKLKGVKCETIAGTRTCHTSRFEIGKRVTDFVISGGKVKRVTVGVVID